VGTRPERIFPSFTWSFIANGDYVREKGRCKELLDISKAKLDEVDEELRNTFKGMEEVRRYRISRSERARMLTLLAI
jgi:hypothetical protein